VAETLAQADISETTIKETTWTKNNLNKQAGEDGAQLIAAYQ
jgi:hypothetical protein